MPRPGRPRRLRIDRDDLVSSNKAHKGGERELGSHEGDAPLGSDPLSSRRLAFALFLNLRTMMSRFSRDRKSIISFR